MPPLAAIAVGDDCDLLSKALGENALLGSGFDPLPIACKTLYLIIPGALS